ARAAVNDCPVCRPWCCAVALAAHTRARDPAPSNNTSGAAPSLRRRNTSSSVSWGKEMQAQRIATSHATASPPPSYRRGTEGDGFLSAISALTWTDIPPALLARAARAFAVAPPLPQEEGGKTRAVRDSIIG